jgi:serine/threonine-protein kinase
MGRVFRARHARLQRDVAVKLLPAELAVDPAFQQRFEREARVLARLSHPHIVTVHDFGALSDGSGYLVMEYVAGGTLRSRLPLLLEEAARVAQQLCSALAYAHAAGVVHRDIKPSNVFLHQTAHGEMPKILDFGIAKIVREAALGQSLTVDGSLLGTPAYMAPERFRRGPYGPKSDVYSLGAMLYEMPRDGCPSSPPPPTPASWPCWRRRTRLPARPVP